MVSNVVYRLSLAFFVFEIFLGHVSASPVGTKLAQTLSVRGLKSALNLLYFSHFYKMHLTDAVHEILR